MQLNAVIILKSTNEYYRKIISKSGCKMDLYPAMMCPPKKIKEKGKKLNCEQGGYRFILCTIFLLTACAGVK